MPLCLEALRWALRPLAQNPASHRPCAHLLHTQSSLSVTLGSGTLSWGRNARMLLLSTLQSSQGGSTHPQLSSRIILGHGHWHRGSLPHTSLQLLPRLLSMCLPAGPDQLPLSAPPPVRAGDPSAGRGPVLVVCQRSVPNSIHKFSRETSFCWLLRARKGGGKKRAGKLPL